LDVAAVATSTGIRHIRVVREPRMGYRLAMHRLILVVLAASASLALAGSEPSSTASDEKVPLDAFDTSSTYVFSSDLNHGGSFGSQYESENRFEYTHRILLSGPWYYHLGLAYDRFDFGNTDAPVPVHLQSAVAVFGVEYMQGPDTGAFLQVRPGFYTEEHLGLSSFDCPILVGRFWTLQQDKLYVLTGVYTSFLKGGFPVLPLVGLVYHASDNLEFRLVPPDPRIIYTINKQLDVFVGGEIAGGSFRTDHHDNFVGPHIAKLSGTQVDFSDYRVGGGFIFDLTNNISINGNAGCSIERHFAFHRAGENYRTDPSPYLQVALKASF
jgi:hypothetical protein